jgi:glycosyltransferase involved in cell wall biosynthesis
MRALYDPSSGAGRILAVHDGMRALLERGGIGRGSLGVLRNPVVPWQTDRIPAERNRTFLFVGRLDVDKGADIAARAAHRAGLPLRMIGTGPLADEIKRDFPQVEVTGWKTQAEIAALCLDARAVVMPTRSRETFGLVALEAMISGLPVIVSSNAMLAPEVVAGNFGLTCDTQDANDLANIMCRVAKDDVVVATMSRNAHTGARRLAPTVSEWTNRLLATYLALLQRSPG